MMLCTSARFSLAVWCIVCAALAINQTVKLQNFLCTDICMRDQLRIHAAANKPADNLVQEQVTDYMDKVLCITFGAPPSSLSYPGSKSGLITLCEETPSLFWNFILADNDIIHGITLLDIMPAVMCTIPKGPEAAGKWLAAVNGVFESSTSNSRAACGDLEEYLQDLMAVGVMHMSALSTNFCTSEVLACDIAQFTLNAFAALTCDVLLPVDAACVADGQGTSRRIAITYKKSSVWHTGTKLAPDYVGCTWWLSQGASLQEAKRLSMVLDIASVNAKQICR